MKAVLALAVGAAALAPSQRVRKKASRKTASQQSSSVKPRRRGPTRPAAREKLPTPRRAARTHRKPAHASVVLVASARNLSAADDGARPKTDAGRRTPGRASRASPAPWPPAARPREHPPPHPHAPPVKTANRMWWPRRWPPTRRRRPRRRHGPRRPVAAHAIRATSHQLCRQVKGTGLANRCSRSRARTRSR